jgi:chitinase domain-containing protein 1
MSAVAVVVSIVLVWTLARGQGFRSRDPRELRTDRVYRENDPLLKSILPASQVVSRQGIMSVEKNRSFPDLKVLGFITPWNDAGIEVAQVNAERGSLDIVVPVTFQVTPSGVEGGLDFDDDFYANWTKQSPSLTVASIYPRFVFERWALQDILELKRGTTRLGNIVNTIVDEVNARGCHGAVLEIWQSCLSAGAFRSGPKATSKTKHETIRILRALGSAIRAAGVETILVLPPYDANSADQSGLVPIDFGRLKDSYEFFVIMTYDFSVPGSNQPGPMAPLQWCESVIRFFVSDANLGSKVLLGLNFYGVDFERDGPGSRHIVGHEYVALLKKYESDIVWLEEYGEDAFTYKSSPSGSEHIVFYPTRRSLRARLQLARQVRCGGVAIWELGQGLPYFMDEV